MMGNFTASGGQFRHIRLTGDGMLSGDTSCERMACTGTLTIQGDLNGGQLRLTGELSVDGGMRAGSVGGRGEVEVRGSLLAEKLSFTGHLQVGGNCESGSFELAGACSVEGLLSAEQLDISLYGPCRVKEIGGGRIRVKQSKAAALKRLAFPLQAMSLSADYIEGDEIELAYTEAGLVRGNRVVIGPGCQIGRVEYRDTLTIHRSASAQEQLRV